MFGFSGAATRSGDIDKDLERARALGSSLLVFLIFPWTLCLIFYSGADLGQTAFCMPDCLCSSTMQSLQFTGSCAVSLQKCSTACFAVGTRTQAFEWAHGVNVAPMVVCAGLHFTYSRDKRYAAREEALLAQENAAATAVVVTTGRYSSELGRPSSSSAPVDTSEDSHLLNGISSKSRHAR